MLKLPEVGSLHRPRFWAWLLGLALVLPSPARSSDFPARNRIPNGYFRLDSVGWSARYEYLAKIDYLATEDLPVRVETAAGGPQLVIAFDAPSQGVKVQSIPFTLDPSDKLSVSLEAQCDEDRRDIAVALVNQTRRIEKTFTIGRNWQSVRFQAAFGSDSPNACRLEVKTSGAKGTLRLRAVSVNQPDKEAAAGLKSAEYGLKPGHALSLFEEGDPVVYDAWTFLPAPDPVRLAWAVRDRQGQVVRSGRMELKQGAQHAQLSLGPLGLGWYALHCELEGPSIRPAASRYSFTVLPRASERLPKSPEQSPFGIHVEATREGRLVAALLGAQWVRLHPPLVTNWHATEAQEGKLTFRDDVVDAFTHDGLGLVGGLDRTPLWASPGKDDPRTRGSNYYGAYAYLPKDWKGWDRYVETVVGRYRHQIKYWQLWSEPDIPFLVPPPHLSQAQAYDQLVRHTVPRVLQQAPELVLMGGVAYLKPHLAGPGRQLDFLPEMCRLGTDQLLPIFTFHHYLHPKEDPAAIFKDLDEVRRDVWTTPHPRIWVTEFGFSGSTSPVFDYQNKGSQAVDANDIAANTIKFHVLASAHGIERVFFYNAFFDTNGLADFKNDTNVMWDAKAPRPIVAAYAIMTWLLEGTRFDRARTDAEVNEFVFKGNRKKVRVLWSEAPTPPALGLKAGETCLRLDGSRLPATRGIQLSKEPLYLISAVPAS